MYVARAPADVHPVVYAEALHEVLDLPAEAEVYRWRDDEARISSDGYPREYRANFRDRGVGPIQVGYSGPRFSNTGCIDCPPLTDDDDFETAAARSSEIIEAFGFDADEFEFTEGLRTDDKHRVTATQVIEGARIGELDFRFVWTHGFELTRLVGSIYEIEAYGTVAPRDEAEALALAESMIGSERSITDFSLSYVGAFNDGEFVLGPAYIATTDLGTDVSVSAFNGSFPEP